MKKLKYILLCVFILTAASVFAVNVTIPQATGYGVIPRGNANGTYTPVATSTLFGYTPLNQSLYYSTTTFTSLTTAPNLSITKSQVSDFGTPVTSISVASANGFAGSSSGGATPALTLSTSITGMLKGNGTAISSASNGTDYTLITAKTCNSGDFVSQVTASGVFTCTTPSGTTYTATYPIQLTANDFSLAFGTTTSNTWAGTQSFTNTANFNTLTNNGNATTTNLAITALTGILVGNGSTKPISTAVSGTDLKTINSTSIIGSGDIAVQPTLVSGTNIKTINGASVLGSGDLTVTGGSGLSSSTPWTVGNVAYVTGNSTLGSVATGTVSAGTGISLDSSVRSVIGGNLQITNSAPDQTVVLNNGTGISVTGTYPNFTITNTGSTFAFPFTVNSGYNATSTVIGFNGLFSTASSTFGNATYFPSLSQGFAYIGSTGKLNSVASSSINLSGFNNNLASLTATNASLTFSGSYNGSTARTVGLNVGNANSWTALQTFANSSTTLGSFSYASSTQYFGAGLTTCNSSNFLQWSGGSFGCGTPSGSGTVTSVVAGAGFQNQGLNITGSGTLVGAFATSATPVLGGLPYYTGVGDATTPAKLGSVATSSIAVGNGLSSSGTLGSQVGGTASTISINSTGLSTNALVTWNGTNLVATGTPQLTVGKILATTTTATSTFAGAIGVGTTSPVSKFVVAGAILGTENKPATSTSMTIDFSTYNQHVVQLGTSATTLTLTGLYAGQAVRIPVCNPGSTASTVTWATSPAGLLLWPGGTVPTQTTTANKCDIYTFTVTQATSTTGAVKVLGGYVQNF